MNLERAAERDREADRRGPVHSARRVPRVAERLLEDEEIAIEDPRAAGSGRRAAGSGAPRRAGGSPCRTQCPTRFAVDVAEVASIDVAREIASLGQREVAGCGRLRDRSRRRESYCEDRRRNGGR